MKWSQSSGHETKTQDEVDLIALLDILVEYRFIILKIAVICVLLATSLAFLFPPRYQADISVQVEDGSGIGAAQSLLGNLSSAFDFNSPSSAEQQIMASRLVVTNVVEELHSYIVVQPSRFPLIGNFISRLNDAVMRPGVLGIGGWAWGTESVDVPQFDVPKRVEGDSFTLTMLADGRYRLSGWDLDRTGMGVVGKAEVFESSYGPITLLVKSFNAQPGTRFKLIRNSRLDAITEMQSGLDIQEKIKASGVLIATLKGTDPVKVRDQLHAVGRYYVKQNVERKAAEAAQSLAFLETQVPLLKQQLEDAEARYTEMRNRENSIDLPEEVSIALQQVADAKTKMLVLQQKRDELTTRFTNSHPDVIALNAQIATLQQQQGIFDQQIKRLPRMQQDLSRLMLEVKVDTDLYTTVLNNVQQLKLVEAGKTSSVRIIDMPVIPEIVSFPDRRLTIAAGVLLGLLLGVGFAFAHNMLFSGISQADEIEKHAGLNVYATIPRSRWEQDYRQTAEAHKNLLLVEAFPRDLAVESLRSLRTALQFAMQNARNNRMLISGPAPGVGKSFVSANFAALLATGGKRVLLIDGDLRRGYLHEYFGQQREHGLTDVIAGTLSFEQAVHRNMVSNLDLLATGGVPSNAAELLMHERVERLLDEISQSYDVVIVDSPPVLAVTDAVVLAHHCATVLLVARANVTRVAELAECARRFIRNDIAVTGALLNGVDARSGRQTYGRKSGGFRFVQYSYDEPAPSLGAGLRRALARVGLKR